MDIRTRKASIARAETWIGVGAGGVWVNDRMGLVKNVNGMSLYSGIKIEPFRNLSFQYGR